MTGEAVQAEVARIAPILARKCSGAVRTGGPAGLVALHLVLLRLSRKARTNVLALGVEPAELRRLEDAFQAAEPAYRPAAPRRWLSHLFSR